MNTQLLLAALAFVVTTGLAQAATPDATRPQSGSAMRAAHGALAKHASKHAARRAEHRKAHALRAADMDQAHQRVVLARSVQQQRWIADELRHGRLDAARAESLRSWQARLADRQNALNRRGQETLQEALAISHEQDLLDWAIRSGHPEFEPPRLLAAS